MRIGVFGGSFDPVHIGHLWIAESALEVLNLDQVRWVPAAQSPLKPAGANATEGQRTAMLKLAIAGAEGHVIDERELARGGVSYTYDTIVDIQQEFPDAELYLIIGSDSLATMQEWHRPRDLLELALPAVVRRGGEAEPNFSVLDGLVSPERQDACRQNVISMPIIELSSSDLRSRIAAGRSIRFRTPRGVEAYIRAEKLYTDGA